MKTEPDDFKDLLALLSIKRHEQPPPDYFEELPNLVVARLQIVQPHESGPWWQRWWNHFEGQPVLVGAYCVAVCGLLFSGLSLSRMAAEEQGTVMNQARWRDFSSIQAPLSLEQVLGKPSFKTSEFDSSLTLITGVEPVLFQFNASPLKARPAGVQKMFANGEGF